MKINFVFQKTNGKFTKQTLNRDEETKYFFKTVHIWHANVFGFNATFSRFEMKHFDMCSCYPR